MEKTGVVKWGRVHRGSLCSLEYVLSLTTLGRRDENIEKVCDVILKQRRMVQEEQYMTAEHNVTPCRAVYSERLKFYNIERSAEDAHCHVSKNYLEQKPEDPTEE